MAMIWRGFYFYRRRMDRRRVLRALAFLLMALALTVLFIAATQMRPLLESMATTRVSNTVTRIVSEAVYEAIEDRNNSAKTAENDSGKTSESGEETASVTKEEFS